MPDESIRLLIAASGTGGHIFPALAIAQQLPDYQIEWLGVPNRAERQLVPERYRLHTISLEGFQQRLGFGTLRIFASLASSILRVQGLLKTGKFQGVFTTGGYIGAPAIIAARLQGLPVILHESNALPGKVTRWCSHWCSAVAVGFESASEYLPNVKTAYVGTPVRSSFLHPQKLELPIPEDVPLIVVVGGSQGAVAVNKLVRQCAHTWFEAGAWIVHLTGEQDPETATLQHPQYFPLPFYDNMAGLLQRANLAISRAGAGTLTELAITKTPAILIPYPYAAEDHQAYNAASFDKVGAALVFPQAQLTPQLLTSKVLHLLETPQVLQEMATKTASLAVKDSAERLARQVRQLLENKHKKSSRGGL
ncbi:MAG: undecaprenyldiphospho-muramoylpentapeptide beta-N-acetylglucosaminyltransferase [Symploca sp. SIO3C6]|uniref:UDP-N-acetylglucosamine--N-acetylmuramyl-(pentapeptide) pyrophosphoryl-undecaprenol N-acetylglucosamine transferase n=1 Tax=Symploca sp. SIO1C4 TaxID=2607765 RepID=A0A6B3NKX1_9CYAN|nr:undecaprenyldiphospho-muramoylpentapeptide beta-N-acetylglucosaminyltransferase [Symploca sp. SIO3C6]NER29888.1 undecaprenyldiphospho-muramoylpentapeptide beta-N-acetylglucosaminyltransferase [Symploca sp. SIO1C4]NET04358.1 undecaprenyldiphospho-muramoylpentapeptide beta-N-acetylglucosaminyltransferase [Symploca sp. SIO2B6]